MDGLLEVSESLGVNMRKTGLDRISKLMMDLVVGRLCLPYYEGTLFFFSFLMVINEGAADDTISGK